MLIRRYLLADVAIPAAAALVIMLSIVWLLQSLRFIDYMVNKGIGFGLFLQLTAFTVPRLLTLIIPLSVLAGVLYGFKRLQDENELTSLFAAGRSGWWIGTPALVLGLLASAASFGLYWHLLPASMTLFKDLQQRLRGEEGHLLLEEGTFNPVGNHLMVYLRKRVSLAELEGLLVHDTTIPGKPVTWMAATGKVVNGPAGSPMLNLQQGIRQEVTGKQVSMLEFAEHTLDIERSLQSEPTGNRWKVREEYLWDELWQQAAQPTKEGKKLLAEAYKRLTWPLTPIPFVCIALAALIRPAGRQRKSFRWLVAAACAGIVYQAALMGLHGVAEGGSNAAIYAEVSLPFIASAIALYIFRRNGRRHQSVKNLHRGTA